MPGPEGPWVEAFADIASGSSEGDVVQRNLAIVRDREGGANAIADPGNSRTVTEYQERWRTEDLIHP